HTQERKPQSMNKHYLTILHKKLLLLVDTVTLDATNNEAGVEAIYVPYLNYIKTCITQTSTFAGKLYAFIISTTTKADFGAYDYDDSEINGGDRQSRPADGSTFLTQQGGGGGGDEKKNT
ncbi:hypothetical protein ACJX0J_010414, partial [Zea mays]